MSRAVPGPVKLRITVLRRVPQDILEGDIQHENRDQHCREDPRRGCLQNSVPRQHLYRARTAVMPPPKRTKGRVLIPSSGADNRKARPALVAASEVITNVNNR